MPNNVSLNTTTLNSVSKLLSPKVSVIVESNIPTFHSVTPNKTDNSDLLATTAYVKNNLSDYYDKTEVDSKFSDINDTLEDSYDTSLEVDSKISTSISNLINGAPAALDTLKEIADVLNDNTTGIGAINTALSNKLNTNITVSGSGNAITSITESNGDLTFTKGSTFSLSNHNHDSVYLGINDNAVTATTATKLGTSDVGSTSQAIYLNNGTPTAITNKTFANALINSLDTGSDNPVDNDYYVSQYVNGGTTTTTFHRRPVSKLYNYIKGKTDALYTPIAKSIGSATKPVYTNANGVITACTYELNKTVPSDAKFTDTVTTVTSSGTGNAVTAITADNGALTVTKGATFSLSSHTHSYLPSSGGTLTGPLTVPAILSQAAGNVTTKATGGYTGLVIKDASASTDGTPNNGIVIEVYKNNASWAGQLFLGDNATQGAYWNGWSDGTYGTWKKFAFTDSNITGTAANVTGTVAIANGGTGATTRLNAVKNLTNEDVGTGSQYFLTITNSLGKAGYCSVANAKTVLGLKSAAYTESSAYAAASHTHSNYLTAHQSLANYLTKTTNVSEMGRYIDMHYDNATAKYDYDVRLYVSAQGTASGGGTLTITAASVNCSKITGAYYADYAEYFPKGEETEPGDVIVLDVNSETEKYIRSSDTNKIVVGVHSDNYSHIIGGETPPEGVDFTTYNEPNYIPVALCGRIATKFIGPAKKGSYVVPSEVTGVARAYNKLTDDPLTIFGILVEDDDNNGNENDYYVRRLKVKLK